MAKDKKEFSYEDTIKYRAGDTFFNFQHLLLVTSGQITKYLYGTSVTPHQVILVSMIIGVASSFLIIQEDKIMVIAGAVLLIYKNILDKVDGSLARARNMASRRGRFYDSISDFIVSFFLFTMIARKLDLAYGSFWVWPVSYAALIFSMLQCSYFVYYEVAFIKATGKETVNRLLEKITDEDLRSEDKLTILLQRIFQVIYGWQDYLVYKADSGLVAGLENRFVSGSQEDVKNHKAKIRDTWYRDKAFLSISSLLAIGSHMFFIALFAVMERFEYYLVLNLIFWNLLLIFSVFYHYYNTIRRLNKRVN